MFKIISSPQKAKDLAEEFEICTRTVYRYIDSLCGAGVPIVSKLGRYGGFEIASYYRIKEFYFTRNEKQYLTNLLDSQKDNNAKLLNLKIKALGTF